MPTLTDIGLVAASVPRTATFADAVRELTERAVPMIAVVDDDGGVVGLFGGEELLRGLFPRYLDELHHTAFARDDVAGLLERARTVYSEPVERHMCKPVTVEADASATHVAERFIHCDLPALAAVRNRAFVGIVGRIAFCNAMIAESGGLDARADD